MKAFKLFTIAFLLFGSTGAVAEFKTIVRASEVVLSELQLPASMNGIVSFKGCGTCDRLTVNVSEATQYMLNGRSVPLSEFRRSVASVSNRETEAALVMHHLESDLVIRISINL